MEPEEGIHDVVNRTDIVRCCVCQQYKLPDNTWTPDMPIYERYRFSDTYCSVDCMSEGSGISYAEAQQIWKEMEDS